MLTPNVLGAVAAEGFGILLAEGFGTTEDGLGTAAGGLGSTTGGLGTAAGGLGTLAARSLADCSLARCRFTGLREFALNFDKEVPAGRRWYLGFGATPLGPGTGAWYASSSRCW